jgi:GT2 family glycosyltransferase
MVAQHASLLLLHLAQPIILTIVAFGLAQNAVYLMLYAVALQGFISDPPAPTSPQLWRRYGSIAPPVSILAPAHNEAPTIVESIYSLLALQYAEFEVVVINDGSTDDTLERLVKAFDLQVSSRDFERVAPHKDILGFWTSPLQPKLLVIDKANGGKGDALNAGLNLARSPIVCAIDSDSLLERDALLRAIRPFIEDPERVIAVGGAVRIVNGCEVRHGRVEQTGLSRNPLALFQTVEYLRAFLMGRVGWSRLGVLTLISGAFGLFTRADLLAVGGWRLGTVGEDFAVAARPDRNHRPAPVDDPQPALRTDRPGRLRLPVAARHHRPRAGGARLHTGAGALDVRSAVDGILHRLPAADLRLRHCRQPGRPAARGAGTEAISQTPPPDRTGRGRRRRKLRLPPAAQPLAPVGDLAAPRASRRLGRDDA